jgi:hypothetical protein
MIKLTSFRLLVSLTLVTVIAFALSCNKKDSLPNDGKTALYSFGPTGTKIGDTIRFIGVNLDKVTAIKFTGLNAVVDKANFKLQTSDLVKVIVPQAAERGQVTLRLSTGDSIVTKSPINLNVLSTVTGISPMTARPGDNVTISGTFLNWIDRVTFEKGLIVANFVSKSQTQLVVTIPDAAQTGQLMLHYGGTDSADIQTADTLKVTLPLGTSLSPNPIKHGDNLTIAGTNLDLVRKVTFTGVSTPITSFVSQSATQLVVKVPASTTKGKVKIEPGSGLQQTVGSADLDLILPAITAMSPNPVDTLTNVTLTGTNLDLVNSVSFVGASGGSKSVTTFVSQSATQLILTVPGGVSSGKITLGVKNSTLTVKSPTLLGVVGAPPPPIIIYDDALNWNGWIGGGWGGTKDLANTTPVKSGTKSIKISYTGGWGVPLQLGGANIPIDGYTTLKISIYGDAGSGGKKLNIGFNEKDGKTVTLVEGQWNDFSIPLTEISSATTLSFLYIKEYNGTGNFTIYVDDIGIF